MKRLTPEDAYTVSLLAKTPMHRRKEVYRKYIEPTFDKLTKNGRLLVKKLL